MSQPAHPAAPGGRRLDEPGQDLLFRHARTHNAWQDRPVSEETLRQLYDLMKWGPTAVNSSPLRILFLRTEAAKQRLAPALSAGNLKKTMAAPVAALLGYDTRFYENLDRLFPHNPGARSWFEGDGTAIFETAFRNSSLQGGYFILAARSVGLDCGPMSGFDRALAEAEFWPDGRVKANFLCTLGYGDPAGLHPRGPRLPFEEVCRVL
ncbi:malonic semialdehyde reductase [Rhodocista pekingensis]|uniref:Putative NADH dehydrogenase/NAD(P)H nitroreductase ACFQPS_16540 n=1 Tax=Rhodocista pekingensis TaxID=201185 RepID=A0ABW2L0T5_9PROT